MNRVDFNLHLILHVSEFRKASQSY